MTAVADDTDSHQPEQQRNGAIDLIIGARGGIRQKVQKIARLNCIEEKRPIVVYGRNVVPIIAVKLFGIIGREQPVQIRYRALAWDIQCFHAAGSQRRPSALDIFGR